MARKDLTVFGPNIFLNKISRGKTVMRCKKNARLFSQGDYANAVFYIKEGRVKLTVSSQHGKKAVIAILEKGSQFPLFGPAGRLVRPVRPPPVSLGNR